MREQRKDDLIGRQFGKLTALHLTDKRDRNGSAIWHCLCVCGKTKDVPRRNLLAGTTKSCGCMQGKHDMTYQQKRAVMEKRRSKIVADALEKSIQHWRDNLTRVSDGHTPLMGTKNCALCALFFDLRSKECCIGCPVDDASHSSCEFTPYEQISDLLAYSPPSFGPDTYPAEWAQLYELCKQQVEFLESLREKKEEQ